MQKKGLAGKFYYYNLYNEGSMETLHLLGLKATHRFWYELFNYFFVIHVTSNSTYVQASNHNGVFDH